MTLIKPFELWSNITLSAYPCCIMFDYILASTDACHVLYTMPAFTETIRGVRGAVPLAILLHAMRAYYLNSA